MPERGKELIRFRAGEIQRANTTGIERPLNAIEIIYKTHRFYIHP